MGNKTMPDPTDLSDNAYRTSFLVYMNPNVDAVDKLEKFSDNIAVDKFQGLYVTEMTMPDGSVEHWREVNSHHDNSTGFKASAFERSNADGSTYLDSETNQPQTMVIFPGNTFSSQDLLRSDMIVRGEPMFDYFKETDKFVNGVVAGMEDRAQAGGYGLGAVAIGTHSLGANGMGAGLTLRECGIQDVQTVMIEPVGAGQALEQLALLGAARRHNTMTPTEDQQRAVAEELTQNITSIRSDDENMFHAIGGDEEYDNAMVGKTYRVVTEDGFGETMSDHLATNVATSILKNGDQALIRTEAQDLTSAEILGGGKDLSFSEKAWAVQKSMKFAELGHVRGIFDKAAAWDRQEGVTDVRPNFVGIGQAGYNVAANITEDTPGFVGPKTASNEEAYVAFNPLFVSNDSPEIETPGFDINAMETIQKGLAQINLYDGPIDHEWGDGTNEGLAQMIVAVQLTDGYDGGLDAWYGSKTEATLEGLDLEKMGMSEEMAGEFKQALASLHQSGQLDQLYSGPENFSETLENVRDNELLQGQSEEPIQLASTDVSLTTEAAIKVKI